MKHHPLLLSACIAIALTGATAVQATPASHANALSGTPTAEAPRVTQAVSNGALVSLSRTHLAFVDHASSATPLPAAATMAHLQLVLNPSAARRAAMNAFITSQHDPKSASFQQWLSPTQFGNAFGVLDSDVAAVTAWLSAQGFTVNNVYPNKTQIDFSGTVAQVNAAFHTQENLYTFGDDQRFSNAGDLRIPAALGNVVAGVVGLNNFSAIQKRAATPKLARWNPATKSFATVATPASHTGGTSQAIPVFGGDVRALVPNDLATIYNVKPLRDNGVTGRGVTLAIVGSGAMYPNSWAGFTHGFNLNQYGAQISFRNPAPASGPNNCYPVDIYSEDTDLLSQAEWATAIAPGINLVIASCSDWDPDYNSVTDNYFGGMFLAANNLVNSDDRPDIISIAYSTGSETFVDSATKKAVDLMWAQADSEGISVFVSSGTSGSSEGFGYGLVINGRDGQPAVSASALATSPNVTAVGGTDLADKLDGTTARYFAATPSVVGGSALSYVPEIPWNESCGNGVAAKALGFSSVAAFCQYSAANDPNAYYITSSASGGAPSVIDAKPAWQRAVFNSPKDVSRDIPDVSLFAGSYGGKTYFVTCQDGYPCVAPDFSTNMILNSGGGTSTAMFAGIQALIDQGLAMRGLPVAQGNAAPTLYALAAQEYGGASGPAPASLAACNSDNGTSGSANCVFHNITRGSISTNCYEDHLDNKRIDFTTSNCFYYFDNTTYWPGRPREPYAGSRLLGLTTTDAAPTAYGVGNKAFGAQPGWSFASGLGSVNAKNLLIAWRAFVNAPPAPPSAP